MHINAKRMKRRINKEPQIVYDPTIEPDYLKATDYEKRAELLGLKIIVDKEGAAYTIKGGILESLEESPLHLNSLQELKAEINSLWELATEPEIECYIDNAGRYHERIAYPESLI